MKRSVLVGQGLRGNIVPLNIFMFEAIRNIIVNGYACNLKFLSSFHKRLQWIALLIVYSGSYWPQLSWSVRTPNLIDHRSLFTLVIAVCSLNTISAYLTCLYYCFVPHNAMRLYSFTIIIKMKEIGNSSGNRLCHLMSNTCAEMGQATHDKELHCFKCWCYSGEFI